MADLPGTEHHPHARATLGAALAGLGAPPTQPPTAGPSHAYLFHGPAGSGKRTAARAFAAALLADGAPDPTGVHTRVGHGTHPDLTWVVPSGAHEMLVGDVEEAVIGAAALTPFEAARRVFVLERADTLIEQAANKLLKTLEEPAPFVHLILLTDRLGEVLPTIRSRCQLVRFDALSPAELAERIGRRGIPPEQAAACARLALGDGERALELALGDGPALRAGGESLARAALAGRVGDDAPWRELLAVRRRRGDAAVAEVEAQLAEQLEFVARRERKRVENDYADRIRRTRRRVETGALDLGLQLSGLWLRDVACVAWGAEDLVHHVDRAAALSEDAAGRDPQRLRAGVELVEDTRRRLRSNVTEELALETLAYRLEALLL
ncbi:MAG TPA: AAA family ATPase [Conexibacter sp.]|jgi:DNA polymerase-3 subunit delta'|nr:AAA family ATPase [Conexibacter sp.]